MAVAWRVAIVMYEPNGFPSNAPPQTAGEYAWVNPADGHAGDSGFADRTGFFSAAAKSPGASPGARLGSPLLRGVTRAGTESRQILK